jgi:hypothetical protein
MSMLSAGPPVGAGELRRQQIVERVLVRHAQAVEVVVELLDEELRRREVPAALGHELGETDLGVLLVRRRLRALADRQVDRDVLQALERREEDVVGLDLDVRERALHEQRLAGVHVALVDVELVLGVEVHRSALLTACW